MNDFETQAVNDINRLRMKFAGFQGENLVKSRYYDGQNRLRDLGISIPPSMRSLDTVVGWPAKAVDALEERLDFEGWSDSGLDWIFQQNDLDVEAPQAHLDALIFGTSFVTVTAGSEGEPDVLVKAASPLSMTGTRDSRTNRLSEAVQFIDSEDGKRAVLFRPDETVWLNFVDSVWRVERVDEHKLGRVMVAQLVNKPRASKVGGRSEITPVIRSLTDSAVRTLIGAEVAREFYAVPQRWMMGAPESFFLDEDGNPRGAWDAMMGKILAIERDDETGEIPTVGHFPANSMSPFFEQLRELAKQAAAEASVPNEYMGFSSDSNPSSADAIRMSENRIVKRAERRQTSFGKAWTEVARLSLMVRDGRRFDDLTEDELSIRPVWRSAATPTMSAATDQVVKLASIGVPFGEYMMKILSMSPQDKAMLERDTANSRRSQLLDNIRARMVDDPTANELAQRRADPMGDANGVV